MTKSAADWKREQRKRDAKKGLERLDLKMGAGTKADLQAGAERAGFESIEELISIMAINLKNLTGQEFEKLTALPKHEIVIDFAAYGMEE